VNPVLLVLNRLRSAIGTGETPPNSNNNFIVEWYNDNVERIGRGPWCQMTVTWAFFTALVVQLIKGRAYTVWAAQDFVANYLGGTWHWGTAGMRAGDIVYFDWSGRKGNIGLVDHVGTVERIVGDGTFYTLEGNNNANQLDRMHRDGKYVVGYGRPDWSRVPQPKPAVPPYPYELHRGALNRYVGQLQARLNAVMTPNPHLAVDNDYGPATQRAVLLWQRQHPFLRDPAGVARRATWNSVFAPRGGTQ
jgi:hypothetical protein